MKAMTHQEKLEAVASLNLEVGTPCTVIYHTDTVPCVVKSVKGLSVVLEEVEATLSKDYKPEFIEGGFVAHCSNQDDQKWVVDTTKKTGIEYKCKFKKDMYGVYGVVSENTGKRIVVGSAYKFYDYNF